MYEKFSLKMRYLMIMSHCLDTTKLAKIYLKDDSKSLLYFFDLDLIFKIKSQLTDARFPPKMRYFCNQLMDILQNCIDMSL